MKWCVHGTTSFLIKVTDSKATGVFGWFWSGYGFGSYGDAYSSISVGPSSFFQYYFCVDYIIGFRLHAGPLGLFSIPVTFTHCYINKIISERGVNAYHSFAW